MVIPLSELQIVWRKANTGKLSNFAYTQKNATKVTLKLSVITIAYAKTKGTSDNNDTPLEKSLLVCTKEIQHFNLEN